MSKRRSKFNRVFAWLLMTVMLLSQSGVVVLADSLGKQTGAQVSNEATENVTGTDEGVTRIQWLKDLTAAFEMSVEEDNYPDNFYADINSEYEYYYEVMLATEFGLVDVEAGDNFNPDDPATREFAVHTLNAGMGYTLSNEENVNYTFAEYQSVTYPDDIQVAVDKGWFTLNSSKQFLPEKQITVTEKDTLINIAKEEMEERKVDENHENSYELKSDVIVVPDDVEVELVDDDIYELRNIELELKVNDKIAIISDGFPLVKQIVAITPGESLTTVTTKSVDYSDAYVSIDVEGVIKGDISKAKPYSDDVQLSYIIGGTSDNVYEDGMEVDNLNDIDEDELSAVKAVQSFEIPEDVRAEYGIAEGVTANVTCTVSNLSVLQKTNTTSPSVCINADVKFTCNVSMDVLKHIGIPGTITLLKLPAGTIGYIKVTLELSLEGSITFNLVENVSMGIKWTSSNGFSFISNFKKKQFSIQTKVKASAGVKISAGIDMGVLKGEIYGKMGFSAYIENVNYAVGIPENCTHVQAWMYASIGANVNLDIVVYKKKWLGEIVIYDITNSPVEVIFHYEDGKPVEKCSRDIDTGGTGFRWKYYTPINSKYGYNGASSGIDSEGNTYAIFEYEKISTSKIRLTKYRGNVSAISIPSTLDGYTVAEIGSNLFEKHNELTMVIIPEGVTVIGTSAFDRCTNLESIEIPNTVTVIGASAFGVCTNLESIEIPNSVTTIGDEAFYACTNLKTVTLPEKLETIGIWAFYNCKSLAGVKLPDSLKEIGSRAFGHCESLTEINIPKNMEVNTYGTLYSPFYGCTSIEKVSFAEGIEIIQPYLFHECTWLESIEIPDSVITIGYYAFSECANLKMVKMPKKLEVVGDYAFYNCNKLSEIELLHNVKKIGYSSFANCSSLTKITIPVKTNSINKNSFSGCRNLTIYGVADSYANEYATNNSIKFSAINIPATELTLNMETAEILDNEELQLKFNITPYNTTDEIKWTSSDETLAIVTDTGLVKTLGKAGTVTITVIAGDCKASCTITIISTKKNGWYQDDNGKWYYYVDDVPQTGWNKIGKWYYFDETGVMLTNWQKIGGKWYYLGSDGSMRTGWKEIGKKWYYFDGSGAMKTDWQYIGKKWYYFDGSGAMKTGWQEIGKKWYYFDGSGAMKTNWQKISGKWYYFDGSGTMKTNWQKISGKWYYFDGSGSMRTGWQKLSNKWYYFNGDGVMLTGNQKIGDKWYYFDNSGVWVE